MLRNRIDKWTCFRCVVFISCLLIGVVIIVIPLVNNILVVRYHGDGLYECRSNLFHLYDALHKYHEVYGTFPPSYTRDDNGKPMHSWRTLILPFLPQCDNRDYQNNSASFGYNYAKPWNDHSNQLLHDKMPLIFSCPYSRSKKKLNTPSYALITEDNPIIGMSSCFLLVEFTDGDFNWLEPIDFSTHQKNNGQLPSVKSNMAGSIGFYHDKWSYTKKASVMTKDRKLIYLFVPIRE